MSIRCKDQHAPVAQEALRRAKFKFPGRQKIITSRNWGFTNFVRDDFVQWRREGRLENDGVNARLITHRGQLSERDASQIFAHSAKTYNTPNHA
mmetsp:Transcript_18310/g.31341  ORF Transcript_18310/g.31341 Transcript_18310/m.31341 type:complete len:94 (-) Transcript_18310:255-536(-)